MDLYKENFVVHQPMSNSGEGLSTTIDVHTTGSGLYASLWQSSPKRPGQLDHVFLLPDDVDKTIEFLQQAKVKAKAAELEALNEEAKNLA